MASPKEPKFVSAVMPDDFTFRDMRDRGIADMPITTFPEPDFPGIRPPRRPRRNPGGFDNDYSFLNLPRAGSGVRGPIDLPDMSPVDSNFQIDSYAPTDLPNVEMLAPTPQPLTVEESQSVLDSVRPFEDSASLGANQNERFAELGRFFGEKVSGLQGNIDELINTKSQLTKDLEAAFLQQDEMSQQAIEEQIAALDAQRVELVAQLEQSVAEAEAQGVDAVAAAEQVTAEQQQQFEGQKAELEGQLQEIQAAQEAAIAERDQAIAEQDTIKAQAADEQVQALEGLKQQLLTEREGIVGGLEEKIGDLQGEINNLTGARDTAIAERDEAIANQDVIKAEAADAQVQALENQKTTLETEYNQTIGDLQGQIDALNTSQVVAETPAVGELPVVEETAAFNPADYIKPENAYNLPADIAVNESVADLGFDPTTTAPANNSYVPITGQDLGLNVDQNLQQAAIDAQLDLDLAQAQGPVTQGQFQAAKNAATSANAQKAFVESGGKTLEQEQAELARENAIASSVAARPPVGTVDMSKINLPENYMDSIRNIQPPQNFNFNNLRVGMKQGGEMNRIQLLLNRLRR